MSNRAVTTDDAISATHKPTTKIKVTNMTFIPQNRSNSVVRVPAPAASTKQPPINVAQGDMPMWATTNQADTFGFLAGLDEDFKTTYIKQFPDYFLDQARAGADYLSIVGTDLSNYFRLSLVEPVVRPNGDGVNAKVSLYCRTNAAGELAVISKEGTSREDSTIRSFGRSISISFAQHQIEQGIITDTDLNNLFEYAQNWAEWVKDGSQAPYENPNYQSRHMFLVASAGHEETCQFRFRVALRLNPNVKGVYALGLEVPQWAGLEIRGKGVAGAAYDIQAIGTPAIVSPIGATVRKRTF